MPPANSVTGALAIYLGLAAAAAAAAAPSAWAAPDCADMKSLISHAQLSFEASAVGKSQPPAHSLPGADQCASAIGEGGTGIYYCSWSFSFRSGEARQLFAGLNDQIAGCLKIDPVLAKDQRVNHPDSFWLNTYQVNGAELSISIKDKSNLGKSLLFLRVQTRPGSGQ